ncbi:unnamed protein product [Pleuronectes platessa]|uniref:Uncharacterized protein n=1 Tax=Pleuronectes platessa TaxID=8262 RepID=A0A9N7Z5W1_PLEPL|nr:unnamed protein product [Pleuronectes platessa]
MLVFDHQPGGQSITLHSTWLPHTSACRIPTCLPPPICSVLPNLLQLLLHRCPPSGRKRQLKKQQVQNKMNHLFWVKQTASDTVEHVALEAAQLMDGNARRHSTEQWSDSKGAEVGMIEFKLIEDQVSCCILGHLVAHRTGIKSKSR